MNKKGYVPLAWSLFGIIAIAAMFSLVGALSNRPDDDNLFKVVNDLLWGFFPVLFALLATLIVTRRPRNGIGWLMLLPAFAFVADFLVKRYLGQYPTPPAVPTAPLLLALWLDNAGWLLLIFPLLFTMLLYPDGRLPSPRWRWILLAGLGMIAVFIFFVLFSPILGPLEAGDWALANPISFLPTQVTFPFDAWAAALIALTLLCAAAPFVRYRRADTAERQQIKWLFFACGLFALVYVPAFFMPESDYLLTDVWEVLFALAVMAVPAAIAFAITRYRLYDVDLIIRKTLVYGALTGLLALVYFGSVVLLQTLFESLTGERSPLIIVLSTLLIAALFAPLRRQLQAGIDRRFYRHKFDAQQVLAAFGRTARDEVDLDNLTAELTRVVQETMQPAQVTLWLKKSHPTVSPPESHVF